MVIIGSNFVRTNTFLLFKIQKDSMKYLILLLSLTINAQILFNFQPQKLILASEINSNINYFSDYFINNQPLAQSGQIITKEFFNNFLSNVNCITPNINLNDTILSSEINQLFNNIDCSFPPTSTYDTSCDCYRDILYRHDINQNFTIDGNINTGIGTYNLNIWLPNNSNGKLVMYFHPMQDTKDLINPLSIAIKDALVDQGYIVVAPEFRHPHIEDLTEDISGIVYPAQYDLVYATDFIFSKLNKLNVLPENVSAVAYSKGSLIVHNLMDNNFVKNFKFKKLYLLDAQVTFFEQTYYDLFIDKGIVYDGLFGSTRDVFGDVNYNVFKALFGFGLNDSSGSIADHLYIDAYRDVGTVLDVNLPEIRFGYNLSDKGRLLRVDEIVPSIFPTVTFDPVEVDYALHNPQSIDVFCPLYTYNSCTSLDGFNYNTVNIVNDIVNFLKN